MSPKGLTYMASLLKPPSASEISSWEFDIRNGCHLTPDIIRERIQRVALLKQDPAATILRFELSCSLRWHDEFEVKLGEKEAAH